MFFRNSKSSSGILYTYDDILLRLYLDVARSGDFSKLVKEGKASDQECLNAWEAIVRKQEKVTGSNQYSSVLQLMKGYAILINDHTVIRACLVKTLLFPTDWEIVQTLRAKGYEIDWLNKVEWIQNAIRRNENLITKATMKQKELQRMFQTKETKTDPKGFEEIIAILNFALGFNVDESITLARYNEYQKILNKRQKEVEEANNKKAKGNGRN